MFSNIKRYKDLLLIILVLISIFVPMKMIEENKNDNTKDRSPDSSFTDNNIIKIKPISGVTIEELCNNVPCDGGW